MDNEIVPGQIRTRAMREQNKDNPAPLIVGIGIFCLGLLLAISLGGNSGRTDQEFMTEKEFLMRQLEIQRATHEGFRDGVYAGQGK